jgi:hypothetical protein
MRKKKRERENKNDQEKTKQNWNKTDKGKRLRPTEFQRKLKRLWIEILTCIDEVAKWITKVTTKKKEVKAKDEWYVMIWIMIMNCDEAETTTMKG